MQHSVLQRGSDQIFWAFPLGSLPLFYWIGSYSNLTGMSFNLFFSPLAIESKHCCICTAAEAILQLKTCMFAFCLHNNLFSSRVLLTAA